MPICADCTQWFSVNSRTPKVCRPCEAAAIAKAAKQHDEKSMSIASLAGWMMTSQRPRRYRRAWEAK